MITMSINDYTMRIKDDDLMHKYDIYVNYKIYVENIIIACVNIVECFFFTSI